MGDHARLDGLELAVRLRSQADSNPLAALFWARLIYAADPDAEAEAIRSELQPLVEAATALIKGAQPALAWWTDVAGPN